MYTPSSVLSSGNSARNRDKVHITILALGSRGDVQPYAWLGKGLRMAGHQVCFITSEDFGPLIQASGLDFYPLPGSAQLLLRKAGANTLALFREFGSFAHQNSPEIPSQLKTTDVLINQLPLGLAGYDLAEKYQRRMLLAAVMPLYPTSAFPLMGMPALPVPGYNKFTCSLAQQALWQVMRPLINRWRRKDLELPSLPFTGYMGQLGTPRIPILNGFSSHVVPRPPDWAASIHMTGYWFIEEDDWQPPDELRAFLDAGPAPVFIGFGSMPVSNPRRVTQVIINALRKTGQRAILHGGWSEIGKTNLPDTIFKIEYAPYGWLFPRMSMIIHHGGSGTTGFALRSGVPSMVVPFLFDQFFWGQRTTALGAGPKPLSFRRLSTERLADAIIETVNNPGMQHAAAQIAALLKAENGILNAIKIIEGFAG
jgi:sterol 3beta-glucosyltransferase